MELIIHEWRFGDKDDFDSIAKEMLDITRIDIPTINSVAIDLRYCYIEELKADVIALRCLANDNEDFATEIVYVDITEASWNVGLDAVEGVRIIDVKRKIRGQLRTPNSSRLADFIDVYGLYVESSILWGGKVGFYRHDTTQRDPWLELECSTGAVVDIAALRADGNH